MVVFIFYELQTSYWIQTDYYQNKLLFTLLYKAQAVEKLYTIENANVANTWISRSKIAMLSVWSFV